MLYENMVKSGRKILGGEILINQREEGKENNWYGRTKQIALEMDIQIEEAEEMCKKEWKRIVKEQINKAIEGKLVEKEREQRKMRHQIGQKFEKKGYLKKIGIAEASNMIRRRLEMLDVGNNQGKQRQCRYWKEKEETEHMIKCKGMKTEWRIEKSWLKETDNLNIMRKVNEFIQEIKTRE